ncbi:hypothetical protein Tco_0716015, partial [Tanacetum coccineum]
MANQLPILQSLLIESNFYELNNQVKVWLSKEVGTGDEFAQDMGDQCYSLKKEMDERDLLIAELEKLAVGSGVKYDANAEVCAGSLPASGWSLFVVVGLLLMEASSRTCVAGDFMVSAAGSASNGSATVCFNFAGTWLVSLSCMVLTIVLQSGTNVCASGLKHVTVVVAVPSSIIALKQYLFVCVMSL